MSSSDQQRNSEHGLSPKDLSILNVAILLTQNRSSELAAEIERAVRNGVSPDGIRAIVDEVVACRRSCRRYHSSCRTGDFRSRTTLIVGAYSARREAGTGPACARLLSSPRERRYSASMYESRRCHNVSH